MASTWHTQGIRMEYTRNAHGIHMTVGTHGIHMECTQNTLNTLGIHMAYTGNTHGMSYTWYAHGTHSMVHIAYSCTWHTHTLHAWNAHGLRMVCTFSTPGLHMASHGIHRLLRMLASHASHLIYSINPFAYPKDSNPLTPLLVFPLPLRPCQCRAHRRSRQLRRP